MTIVSNLKPSRAWLFLIPRNNIELKNVANRKINAGASNEAKREYIEKYFKFFMASELLIIVYTHKRTYLKVLYITIAKLVDDHISAS